MRAETNGKGGWGGKPTRSNSPPLSMKRPSSWDTSEETTCDANGWSSNHIKDDIGDDASSSGHTDFQDPEDDSSRPVSQEDIRVKVENGLATPVDSLNQLSPLDGKSDNATVPSQSSGRKGKGAGDEKREVEHLGRGYMVVKTRRRVTVDGGRSLLAIENTATESQGK